MGVSDIRGPHIVGDQCGGTIGAAADSLFEFDRLEAGETVLVQAGAGGVGLAAIQLAKRPAPRRSRLRPATTD